MSDAEARGLPYLFKIKRTGLAKELFSFLSKDDGWTDCGCGWEGREHRIRLGTWKLARRCIFIRRPNVPKSAAIPLERVRLPAPDGAKTAPAKGPRQLEFDFAKDRKGREWDYCILVTNDEKLDLTALSQLYRDRGDPDWSEAEISEGRENNFDEFKNQWGWSGFTTKRLKPCKAMARLVAIVANLWNVFVRLADPDAHREPVTSRPAFLNIVGRIVMNGGRRVIHLTSAHAEADAIRASLCLIGKFLEWADSIAEQLNPEKTVRKSGELDEATTCSILEHMGQAGVQWYRTKSYNLDAILSVGYRVNSYQATCFRRWASTVLKEFLLHGMVVNQRMIAMEDRIDRRLSKHDADIVELRKDVDFFISSSLPPKEKVFVEGKMLDAQVELTRIVKTAKSRIVLVDNYIDERTLMLLGNRRTKVVCTVYTLRPNSPKLAPALANYAKEYPVLPITVKGYKKSHDRFLIVDNTVWHIGASLKDAGSALFAMMKMELDPVVILGLLP